LLGDFNVPGNDRVNDISQANSYYCNKIRGDLIHSAMLCLGLSKYNCTIQNKNYFIFFFTNVSDVNVTIYNLGDILAILSWLSISVYLCHDIHTLLLYLIAMRSVIMYHFAAFCLIISGLLFTINLLLLSCQSTSLST
jgi:hypothetical protein